ncbi:prepilin-type N-terminal cleavage/methylation domain-containing protein [bacterium]|nr:prepilin-type N-terminal cleavage/methylation domain-containing protein [candidate division CSSED10-310 bacterium]
MSLCINKGNRHAGFSLVEMLISMVVFSVVMGIIYSFLLQTKKDLSEAEVELDLTDNAQSAINALRKDLYQIGIGRDTEKTQPQILRAGMFDLIFVADLDREVRSTDKRYGSPDPNLPMSFSPGSPFLPIYFLFDPGIPELFRFTGWDPSLSYGYNNLGAEVVRYSLDCNGDNVISSLDLEDNIEMDGAREQTINPNDFWLFKEWWGCYNSSGVYINQHSGRHPVAFNIKGMFYKPTGGTPSGTNSRFIYPDGSYPKILFTYWGHFWNSITDHDDPGDPDWPGEPLDLWGDFGLQNPIQINQPITPGVDGSRDGVLDMNEINEMMSNPNKSEINLLYLAGITGRCAESLTGDENGNGIPGEYRIDQFIRRIGVTLVVEADSPNPKSPNLERSNMTNPSAPGYYYYKDYEVSIQINPRNLIYSGSPLVDMGQMTPTPIPPTSTPLPPTNTPDPSIPTNTPTNTHTPDPMATPTATPDQLGFDKDDGEVVIGGLNYIYGLSIDRMAPSVSEICALTNSSTYLALFGYPVTQVEPANFCDLPGSFDPWNDVVMSNNANGGLSNLFYYKHNTESSVNGFSTLHSTSVGYDPSDRITCFATGNIGPFGYVPDEYDEVVVAYHRYNGAPTEKTLIEVMALNYNCGDLISVSNPPPLSLDTNRIIKDMLIADFDGDGIGELVTMTSHFGTEGVSQIRYYPDIFNQGWSTYHEFPILNFGTNVQCAKLVADTVYTGNAKPIEPDLIIVGENGRFAVITNRRSGTVSPNPFNTTIRYSTSDAFDRFSTVTGAVVYDSNNLSSVYEPVMAISGNSDVSDNVQLVHYQMTDIATSTIPLANCSGSIWPTPGEIISTKGMSYVPVFGTVNSDTYLVIPVNVGGIDYATFIKNPVLSSGPVFDPSVSCQLELYSVIGGINCITSTRNELSGDLGTMPTPTVLPATPTP